MAPHGIGDSTLPFKETPQNGKLLGADPDVYFARWDVLDHGKIELTT
jgi:hypothetical protein